MNPDNIPESPATRKLRLFLESRGEQRGRAASLLLVLEQRGLPVSEAERARIRQCGDAAQLDAWLRRALTAESVADVLAEGPPAPDDTPRPKRRVAGRTAAPRPRPSRP